MRRKWKVLLAALACMGVMLASTMLTSAAENAKVVVNGSRTYQVGEAFRAGEVQLWINAGGAWNICDSSKVEIYANGNRISNGYCFKEAGKKTMVLKCNGYRAQYELTVNAALNGTLKEWYILTEPSKLTYRQSTEPFNPSDVVVRCYFTNGTTQDVGYTSLQYIAGGNPIKPGYRFTVPGKKTLEIVLGDYSVKYTMTVVPTFDKSVASCEMLAEPVTMQYKVGQGFQAHEYAIRCHYQDGTTEDFDCSRLNITANGVQMYENYPFQQAGQKNIVVTLGDYSTSYTVKVTN
ncbi:MAG: bacterial Ig-like domain-containing protein [Lachnospiraceae bacterium]|nr:bacterial Ig-like domain-containing protein [Lachnospiraceae bacterium]